MMTRMTRRLLLLSAAAVVAATPALAQSPTIYVVPNGQGQTYNFRAFVFPGSVFGAASVPVDGVGGNPLTGLAGSPSTYGLTIQGMPGGTPVPAYAFTGNNAPVQPHVCGSYAWQHITSNTDTQLVLASGTQNIYVCDIEFSFTAAGAVFLEKSATGTCVSPTQIAMAWTAQSAGQYAKGHTSPYYQGLNTGAGEQLCVNTTLLTGGGTVDFAVYYDRY